MRREQELDRLLVAFELDSLLSRLARAVDRADPAGIAACYTEDSLDDHGVFRGTGAEFADYICGPTTRLAGAKFVHHLLGQSLYSFDLPDAASGETYYVMHMQVKPGELFIGTGRYLDHFVRRDGQWLIQHRQVVTEWNGHAATEDLGPWPDDTPSRRDRHDPLYGFLETVAQRSSRSHTRPRPR